MRAIPGELRKVIFPALCGIALALTALLLGSYLDRFIQPKLESAESPRITLALPTKLLTDGRAVALSLVAPKYFGTELMIQSSGCLIAIELNGVPLQPVAAQSPCLENAPWGSTFDAQGTIQVGANRLKLTFADGVTSAVLNLAIASWDRRLVSVRVGALVLLTMAWWLLAKGFSLSGERHLAWWVFYLAALLRITYFWSTPPWLRAYDFSWHFNYIRHVANHWNIPSAANDPMFYHPPLAYFFAAVPYRLGVMFDLSFAELARLVQVGSFVCSLLIFITCFAACYLVSLSSRLRVLGGVFWATTPALILPGLRVNNDLLAQFFQFLVVALALLWWREPRFRSWCGVAAVSYTHLTLPTNREV